MAIFSKFNLATLSHLLLLLLLSLSLTHSHTYTHTNLNNWIRRDWRLLETGDRKRIRRAKTDKGSFPLLYIIKRLYPVFYEYILVYIREMKND